MYCSLRFYIDKTPDLTSALPFLALVKFISETINYPIDYLGYVLLDPNSDNYLINERYKYNEKGIRRFSSVSIIPSLESKEGETMSPVLIASRLCPDFELYSDISIWLSYQMSRFPMSLLVNFKYSRNNKIDFDRYLYLIEKMNEIGYHVNNGFYSGYFRKNEALTFEGGRIGHYLSFQGKRNIDNFNYHRMHNLLNHLMGIYYANSIVANVLSDDQINKIREIVGKENVVVEEGILSFTLDTTEKMTPFYHLKYLKIIKKLEKLLIYKEEEK